jgi:hypothetical protein
MAGKYDDTRVTITFTYGDWALVDECLSKRRKDHHARADMLELDNLASAEQIKGLRRKATAIFELMQKVGAALAEARRAAASAQAGEL